jgi:hypothetical protein
VVLLLVQTMVQIGSEMKGKKSRPTIIVFCHVLFEPTIILSCSSLSICRFYKCW